jgi:non-ribosomal peptide synthetase component E (peptide arylation enzyme)
MIDRHPKVLQSAIVPMPDEVMGEKACAFILTRPGERVSLQEICEWLSQNDVAKMQWPEHVELIDEMADDAHAEDHQGIAAGAG